MKRKELALPKTVLLLMTGVFGHVNGVKWISMNGQNVSAYATNGPPVTIECTIALPDEPGSFILFNQAIWRAVGVSSELSPASPLWTVVLDRLNVPGYTPDPDRMSSIFPVHTSARYMRIGIQIQVPLPSDSGLYFCNGSYVSQSGGPTIVENSGQVYLSVTGTVPAATWITVNNWYWPSFNTEQYRRDKYQLQCNSYVTDSNSSITSQYILKNQSYLIDILLDGSNLGYQTGQTRMKDYSSPGEPIWDIRMFGPTQHTPQQMTSGFNFGHHAANTGVYDCYMQYTARGNLSSSASATNFAVTIPDKPIILVETYGRDALGNEKLLHSFNRKDDIILDEKFTVASVQFRVWLNNEAPAFQLTVNNADVASKDMSLSSLGPLLGRARFEDSVAFRFVKYGTWLFYDIPISSVCKWQVTCRAWVPSVTNQISTVSFRLITKSCFQKDQGSALINKASVTTVTPLYSGQVACTMSIALLIRAFTA